MKNIIWFTMILFLLPYTVSAAYLNEDSAWSNGMTGSFWTSIITGDIDNDGYNDLIQIGCTDSVATACTEYLAKVYVNNGTSFVDDSQWSSNLTAVHYGSIALGDIDSDGDLDLALSGCLNGGGSVSSCPNAVDRFSNIYVNNGTSFVESVQWKGDIQNTWKSSFAFGDINLDGKLDLILSGGGALGRSSNVYLNNGTSFVESSTWQQELTGVYGSSSTLVDVDNDGDLDLFLVGDSGSGYIARAYTNNGTSFVANSSWYSSLLGVELTSTVWGDFDNNGRMDFSLIGHTSSDEHEIYNNTGSSLISIKSSVPAGDLIGIFEGTQSFGDYDNDGDLDLFTSGEERYSTLYINNNTFGGYLDDPEPQIFNTAYGPGAVWSDVDNDDDLDLILNGFDYDQQVNLRSYVYVNNITTKNTAPSPPGTLSANYSNGVLNLSWSAGSDAETPALGLYYNLRVGTSSDGHQIVTGVYGGGDDNGYFGNMMQRRNIMLNLPNLNGTIYWSVQTIDTALKAGSWAIEETYIIEEQQQQQEENDTEAPNITITSPLDGSTVTSSSVTVSADFVDNSSVTCDTRIDTGSWYAMSISYNTSSYAFTLSNAQYTAFVNCTDVYNNSDVKNVTFTVNVVSNNDPPPGGGGSPGGGSTTTTTPTNTTTTEDVVSIGTGEMKTIEVANTAMKQVTIKAASSVSNVHVQISKTTKPVDLPDLPEDVYEYVEIETVNITDTEVDTAFLTFSVEKSWIDGNRINRSTVKLNRYDNGWQSLKTTLRSENATHITYEAETPGFSLFAITGEKTSGCGNGILETGEQCDGEFSESCITFDFEKGTLKCTDCLFDTSGCYMEEAPQDDYTFVGGVAVIILAVIGGYLYFRKHKPKPAQNTQATQTPS